MEMKEPTEHFSIRMPKETVDKLRKQYYHTEYRSFNAYIKDILTKAVKKS